MITLISLILVLVGCANWLCIGLLQFDFVAGIFGSQANIFSRIVYVIIGVGAAIVVINLIKNKGKLTFNFKKLKKENFKKEPALISESGNDSARQNFNQNYENSKNIDSYQNQDTTKQNYENRQYSNYSQNNRNQMEASSDMNQNHPNSPLNDFNNSYSCKDCNKDNCDCNNQENNHSKH